MEVCIFSNQNCSQLVSCIGFAPSSAIPSFMPDCIPVSFSTFFSYVLHLIPHFLPMCVSSPILSSSSALSLIFPLWYQCCSHWMPLFFQRFEVTVTSNAPAILYQHPAMAANDILCVSILVLCLPVSSSFGLNGGLVICCHQRAMCGCESSSKQLPLFSPPILSPTRRCSESHLPMYMCVFERQHTLGCCWRLLMHMYASVSTYSARGWGAFCVTFVGCVYIVSKMLLMLTGNAKAEVCVRACVCVYVCTRTRVSGHTPAKLMSCQKSTEPGRSSKPPGSMPASSPSPALSSLLRELLPRSNMSFALRQK